MKLLKQIIILLLLIQIQAIAKENLTKNDPEVLAKCDVNGDKKIKGREYVCFLDLKKKKLDEDIKGLDEDNKKLDEDIKRSKQKLGKLLKNK